MHKIFISIHLSNLNLGERLVSTQCGHVFCYKCMDDVMEATNGDTECPICKKRITRNIFVFKCPGYWAISFHLLKKGSVSRFVVRRSSPKL